MCGIESWILIGDVLLQELLFTSIQEGTYDFPEREWSCISEEAKDLIRRLLVKEARQRISADCVLNHPWLQPGSSSRGLFTPHIIRRLVFSFVLEIYHDLWHY